MKHTPGPWTIMHTPSGYRYIEHNPTGIRTEESFGIAKMDSDNEIADAALIAAAPEMLEALEQLVFWYDQYRPKVSVRNGDDPSGFVENLDFKIARYREIIAKARGEK